MTIDELKQKRDRIEANILAMGICLAQQRHLLNLVERCIASPCKENLDILEGEERDYLDWLARMASSRLPCPAPAPLSQTERWAIEDAKGNTP